MVETNVIVTMPPYAGYMNDVLNYANVSGIRLNTVMPKRNDESYEDLVGRINEIAKSKGKDLWIDLKCRQLRVKSFGSPPFTEIEISHNIEVLTPCRAYFSDKDEYATVLEVEKNRLIMKDGPRRVVGPGESVTITHPTLNIEGFLTSTDKEYINAGKVVGCHNYMVSFVEDYMDLVSVKDIDNKANLVAKIESKKGFNYVAKSYDNNTRLMGARGDLYMELDYPHKLPKVMENILKKDNSAIAASRIMSSLVDNLEPSCSDVSDFDSLLRMGYRNFMLGDEVCLEYDSINRALNVIEHMSREY